MVGARRRITRHLRVRRVRCVRVELPLRRPELRLHRSRRRKVWQRVAARAHIGERTRAERHSLRQVGLRRGRRAGVEKDAEDESEHDPRSEHEERQHALLRLGGGLHPQLVHHDAHLRTCAHLRVRGSGGLDAPTRRVEQRRLRRRLRIGEAACALLLVEDLDECLLQRREREAVRADAELRRLRVQIGEESAEGGGGGRWQRDPRLLRRRVLERRFGRVGLREREQPRRRRLCVRRLADGGRQRRDEVVARRVLGLEL
mmetsp:Transcript_3480/g.6649  ORF Transcript_3480/g.6649 Transcript_3480/m.6649 type:complete len:259 (+) Transcript_3480:918-1694(+)